MGEPLGPDVFEVQRTTEERGAWKSDQRFRTLEAAKVHADRLLAEGAISVRVVQERYYNARPLSG